MHADVSIHIGKHIYQNIKKIKAYYACPEHRNPPIASGLRRRKVCTSFKPNVSNFESILESSKAE